MYVLSNMMWITLYSVHSVYFWFALCILYLKHPSIVLCYTSKFEYVTSYLDHDDLKSEGGGIPPLMSNVKFKVSISVFE